ncbi:MAG: Crp/Fnr family transcriptional regulator [Candidatus Marinimicrobia bacterium]|nr:Crp/Fnr family transcriptional regulator [Candidatus Neomarinimicrobiota bacterium]MBT6871164.1 Crp/Fnr family transcriptional regulator [Candidatus Neomarinimicrobiota bacterium]MBT7376916.1 Crp/Fnr family transcriptional regulator [Candidatus Neomarinimicrobiota bacterium]|tara:strand:- start:5367 stop:6074 length:708 start_codon:yes stop_codon:yes gene_type:complete
MKLDTVKEIAENLDEIHVFSDLSEEELEKVANLCTPRTYPKNSMIILEEEFGDTVFGIIGGTVKITRVNDEGKEVILALLGQGELFGELAVLDGEARSANALAQEKCLLLAFPKGEFLNLLKTNFKISFALMGELAKRLRKSDQQIEALSLSDAEHRIGVSILNLAEDMGIIKKGQVTIEKLPFQQDIANMAGTSRETVSRVLTMFEEKSMITKEGHTLVIPDYLFFKRLFGKNL